MKRISQAGYMYEYPVLFVLIVVVLSAVLPRLSPLALKISLTVAYPVLGFVIFYMVVTLGWQPNARRSSYRWRLVSFLVLMTFLGYLLFIVWLF